MDIISDALRPNTARLTAMQIAIIQGMINGKVIKQIASEAGITESNVKIQLFRARQRVGVESLYQLIALAVGLGLCNIDVYLPAAAPETNHYAQA